MNISVISRGKGRSAVGASAYRAGEKITNEYDGLTHDYTNKKGIEYTEVILPENAPKAFKDRKILWNEVEKIEKSIKAQLSREVEIALPKELSLEENINLLKEYAKENFVDNGMCADIAVHDKKDGNPHAHIMLTMRPIQENGEWGGKSKKEYTLDKDGEKIYDKKKKTYKCKTIKTTNWDEKETLGKWRENWAIKVNERLLANKIYEKISHLSLEEQGIERIPQIHIGPTAAAIEKNGSSSDRATMNRAIKKENQRIEQIKLEVKECKIEANDVQKNIEYLEKAKALEEKNKQIEKKKEKAIPEEKELVKISQEKEEPKEIKKEVSYEDIENKYIELKKATKLKIQKHNNVCEQWKEEKNSLLEIEKSKESFEKMKEKRNELISEKESLKLWNFNRKKEIELEIEKYDNSIKQAESNFKNKFGIDIKDDESINELKVSKDTNMQLYQLFIVSERERITEKKEEIKKLELELGISLEEKKSVEKKGIFANLQEIKVEKFNSNKSSEKNKIKNFDRER